jgi:TolB protein
MKTDGSQKRRLTVGKMRDGAARWSPDGRRIAFNRYTRAGGGAHIYVVNADGSDLRQLTRSRDLDGGPTWSPDGRRIAFGRFYVRPGQSDLLLMTAAGRSQRKVTDTANTSEDSPQWSPVGPAIAFLASTYRGVRVEVIGSGGRGQRTLARNAFEVSALSWDSTGTALTFAGHVDPGGQRPSEIYTVAVHESRPTRVTRNDLFEETPQWRP